MNTHQKWHGCTAVVHQTGRHDRAKDVLPKKEQKYKSHQWALIRIIPI